jgi:hypothetical protein
LGTFGSVIEVFENPGRRAAGFVDFGTRDGDLAAVEVARGSAPGGVGVNGTGVGADGLHSAETVGGLDDDGGGTTDGGACGAFGG